MPEEKKENKAAAKDSFTFSDKIKNSKPAASKSFANRISSKIGSDGKPKKTLFERTKRDAPFFIAAIVALLLLPFLYKYSGSVDEDPTMVTPATEDTLFDPNRSGFDGIGDPEGQIAQLSGRDSMDLIVGFGNKQEEVSDELPIRNDFERSGLDEDYGSTNNTAKEYNEKNVYRYKKQAAPATKAAFKKTNINPLRGAGLTSRSGGKLGVGMWGGGLKKAADKVKADAPKSSPKPVSLQPLQAAGKPSRSYFGQGAAAEARRSKDAMSKANAMQALMDAQMKPIEPGKIGGIGGGDFGGPGGGNGNLDRKFAFNGKEPWWWDMMKKRSQMEWEAEFNRKWDWIKFGDKLAQQLLDGLLSCVLTGTDDWSMGKIGGAIAGAGAEAKCGELTKEGWDQCAKCREYGEFNKSNCKSYLSSLPQDSTMVKKGWQGSNSSDVNLNVFESRWDCLTNGAFSARKARKGKEGVMEEISACNAFYQNGSYHSSVGGDYSLYHYVVGVRAEDWAGYVKQNSDDERKKYLSIGYFRSGGNFSIDPTQPTQFMNNRGFIPLFVESVAVKNKKIDKKKTAKAEEGLLDDKVSYKGYWGTGSTKKSSCGSFGPTPYKEAVKLCAAKKPALTCRKDCMDSINSQIKGKNKVKALNVVSTEVGMPYSSFMELLREGGLMTDSGDGKDNLSLAAKGGKEGKDWVIGARCAYPLAFASCHQNAELKAGSDSGETNAQGAPAAFVSMPNIGNMDKKFYDEVKKLFMVTYKIAGKDEKPVENTTTTSETAGTGRAFFVQTLEPAEGYAPGVAGPKPQGPLSAKFNVAASGHGLAMAHDLMNDKAGEQSRAIITWEVRQLFDYYVPWSMGRTIQDGAGRSTTDGTPVNGRDLPGVIVSTATCVYGDEGAVSFGVPENKCPQGKDTNEKCCKDLGGSNYEWNGTQCVEKRNPQSPIKEGDGNIADGQVRLAPVIEWVPSDISARLPVVSGQNPTAVNFTGSKAIPTKNDSQHCGAEMSRIMIESTAATKFANDVVDAYNAKYSEKPMAKVSASYPTMGEFVDALYVASQLGISDVPKDAVCMLGQAMAQVSRDKHAGSLTWGDNRPFFNELGSYLAYVHPEAAYYPAKYYETATNCDKRFLAVAEAGCPATILVSGVKDHREFHHGNYAWNSNTSKYLASLTPGMKKYPLRALAAGVSFSAAGCTKGCGPKRKEYNRTFKFLLRGQCPQGNMQVADALQYVSEVCSTGLDYKPQGSLGNASGPSRDNSGPSGNNSVR
ncbi:MAG: hypothetical protein PUC11_01125 [Elusimicrobia bacterium]|nr:hypothetical protein [Elusimicrobiota bacterium]